MQAAAMDTLLLKAAGDKMKEWASSVTGQRVRGQCSVQAASMPFKWRAVGRARQHRHLSGVDRALRVHPDRPQEAQTNRQDADRAQAIGRCDGSKPCSPRASGDCALTLNVRAHK